MATYYTFTVTKEGFDELNQFMTEYWNEYIIGKRIDSTYSKYVIIIKCERELQEDMFKLNSECNLLVLNDYNLSYPSDKMCLTLITETPEIILEVIINEEHSNGYGICNDDWYAGLQNISNIIYYDSSDIISVKDNKLLFCSDFYCEWQPNNQDLIVVDTWERFIDEFFEWEDKINLRDEDAIKLLHLHPKYISNEYNLEKYKGISMKRYFDKIDFESIEYATVKVSSIIKSNYYYGLTWIGKMTGLKRLNLIFDVSEDFEDMEEFINGMNITILLENLVIRTSYALNLDKLKIPFGCKVFVDGV
jgi:hypothetical protein